MGCGRVKTRITKGQMPLGRLPLPIFKFKKRQVAQGCTAEISIRSSSHINATKSPAAAIDTMLFCQTFKTKTELQRAGHRAAGSLLQFF